MSDWIGMDADVDADGPAAERPQGQAYGRPQAQGQAQAQAQAQAGPGYVVMVVLSDDSDTIDEAGLMLSVLSVRSYCGSDVPICIVGSKERHEAALGSLPPIGVKMFMYMQAVPQQKRVEYAAAQGGWDAGVVLLGTTTLVWDDLALVSSGQLKVEDATTREASTAAMVLRIMQRDVRLTHWPSPAASVATRINLNGEVPVPVCLPQDEEAGSRALGPALAVRYYVISLRGRPERQRVVARMRAALPNLTAVDAVDGAALGAAELRALEDEGFICEPYVDRLVNGRGKGTRRLLVNSVAVTLSHRRALAAVAADLRAAGAASRGAVVLEDDAALRPGFLPVVDGVASTVDGMRVDLVRLYVMPSQRVAFPKTAARYALAPTPGGLWGSQAYFVPDAEAADAVLAGLWPMLGTVDEQLSRIRDLAQFALVGPPVVDELPAEAPSLTLSADRPARYVDDVMSGR